MKKMKAGTYCCVLDVVLLLWLYLSATVLFLDGGVVHGFTNTPAANNCLQQLPVHCKDSQLHRSVVLFATSSDDDDKKEEDETDSDLFRALLGEDDDNDKKMNSQLGIDFGSMLEPLTDQEAADMRAAATEIINDAVAGGLDEIETLRAKLKRELESQARSYEAQSEFKAKQEEKKLLNKIDMLTDAFLSSNEFSRRSTKRAAAADKATGASGKGVEIGVWGVLNGAAVTTTGGSDILLGSFQANLASGAKREQKELTGDVTADDDAAAVSRKEPEPRITIVADTSSDPFAKQLVTPLTRALQDLLEGLHVDVYTPTSTSTLPLGADNSQAIVLFLSSLSDKAAVKKFLDRALRRTIGSDGAVGLPPTQIFAVSTLGTTRFDKMPYSMQNLMGGKLEKRRQMEESVIATVQNRNVEPALDYTICHLGELKPSQEAFSLEPLDALDGKLDPSAAVDVLTQAICCQPFARNATFCATGSIKEEVDQDTWDEFFLKLDGPQVFSSSIPTTDIEHDYSVLSEYVREWADLLATSGKGLTTPIRAIFPEEASQQLPSTVKSRELVQLIFLPTKTGSNYLSKEEERIREKAGQSTTGQKLRVNAKEGGLQVSVEVTKAGELRIRATRCNYADKTVLKEISEATLIKRLEECILSWQKENKS